MKTLKLALVAMFVAFTMVSMSNSDGFRTNPNFKKVIILTYAKAIQNPGLVSAMHQQIYKADVLDVHQYNSSCAVIYQKNTYLITGTREQWMNFFRMKGTPPQYNKARKAIIE
jgi:hypothetical protein